MNNIYYQRPNNSQNTKKPQNPQDMEQQYYQPSYKTPVYGGVFNPEVSGNARIKEWIANGALIVLSIVMVISILVLFEEVNYMQYRYEREAEDFWYSMEYGSYPELVKMRWNNEALGVRETADLTQCYAAADYFEAASLYKSALYLGNIEGAQKYLEDMKEAYVLLGDISYITEDINETLGIESPVK